VNLKEIRRWQNSSIAALKQKDLGMKARASISKSIALWEIAAQLSILNSRGKSSPKKDARK